MKLRIRDMREDNDLTQQQIANILLCDQLYIPPREHHLHGVLAPRSRCFSATLYGVEHHPL